LYASLNSSRGYLVHFVFGKYAIIRKYLFAALLLFCCFGCSLSEAATYNVLILRDNDSVPFVEITRGFRLACDCVVEVLNLEETDTPDLNRKLADTDFKLIVAIGTSSAKKALHTKDKRPLIITGMVDPGSLNVVPGVYFVNITVALQTQLQTIHDVLPDARRIALIYTSTIAGSLERELKSLSNSLRAQLMLEKVGGSAAIPETLANLRGKCDVILIVPDHNLITAESLTTFALFSLQNDIPLVTFAPKYLRDGALLSISAEPLDIGKEVGRVAKLAAANDLSRAYTYISRPTIKVNSSLSKKLRVRISSQRSTEP
jgi:putative tryptophan/tyrosine transport system substrate-binding protein